MLERFLPRTEFDSYEDFKKNYEKIDEPSELSAKSGNVLREGGVGNEK